MTSDREVHILVISDTEGDGCALVDGLEADGCRVTATNMHADAPRIDSPGLDDRFDLVLINLNAADFGNVEMAIRLIEARAPGGLPVLVIGSHDLPLALALIDRLRPAQAGSPSRFEERLAWAAKMESIGTLNSGVAHDIKNHLAQIQMGIEALHVLRPTDEHGNDEAEASVFPIIEGAIDRADALLDGLIRFSSKFEFALEPGDLGDIVRKSLNQFDAQAQACGVAVETELASDLPATMVDHLQIAQIIGHLLTNALEAVPRGGQIIVRTARSMPVHSSRSESTGAETVSLVIEDSGAGISEEALPRVFAPFFSTKETGRGHGLGLTLAEKLIALHGGSITIENRRCGAGTKVTVQLRAAP